MRATIAGLGLGALACLPVSIARAEDAVAPAREPVVLRVALSGRRPEPCVGLTPLSYRGGFHTKTLVYEPLLRVGAGGSIEPGLAESWTQSPDGRTWTFRLRAGVRTHDDAVLDAAAVEEHARRVLANPGNRWLGSTALVRDVRVVDPRTVVFTLSDPWYLPGDIVAVNPWLVVAPGSYDYEGTFVKTSGTGPFRLAKDEGGTAQAYEAHRGWWRGAPGIDRVEAKIVPDSWRENHEVLRALLTGEVDLVADGEVPVIPREELARVQTKPWLRVWRGPGSSVHYLLLNTTKGPTASRDVRRRLAASVDRAALVAEGELGYAVPSTTMFRGGHLGWPAEGRAVAPESASKEPVRLRLLLGADASPRVERHAALLRKQAAGAGIDLVVETARSAKETKDRVDAGDYEVLLRATHGAPYDPWISLQALYRKDAALAPRTAARGKAIWEDEAIRARILEAESAVEEAARNRALAAIQARLDEEVPVVPLFVNDRIAVSVAELEGLEFGTNAYDLGLGRVRLRER
jgi:ABC-type transport system substrate-binding protein